MVSFPAAYGKRNDLLRYLYSILFYLALPFFFLRLLWRSRRNPGYRQRWSERLGFCPFQLGSCIWVHAVSVGETLAAVPLIKALLKEFPDIPIVVTNMTPTGAARTKAVFAQEARIYQAYIPYDLPGAIERFICRIHPQIAIIMETELWPNLFAGCQKHHIPIVITNARLSEKSALRYTYIPSLRRDMFSAIHHIAAQSSIDAERFITLGLPREKMTIAGNLKFDLELPIDLSEKSLTLREQLGKEQFIWIAASTHPGEEEIILAAHSAILKKYPSALLILVPRHPERFNQVAEMIKQQGFDVVRRSSGEQCNTQTTIYLGDTMGELLILYAVADVALVAGSFVKIGGHNMLEPAALHKPILTGPVLFNFAEISQMLLEAKGMIVVKNPEELALAIEKFVENKADRLTVGENAYQVVAANRGALQKQLQLIHAVLG
jgi:3-deoxy-D-manno-octulosonic-acid transferase